MGSWKMEQSQCLHLLSELERFLQPEKQFKLFLDLRILQAWFLTLCIASCKDIES